MQVLSRLILACAALSILGACTRASMAAPACTVDYFNAPPAPSQIAVSADGQLWFESYDAIGRLDVASKKARWIRTHPGTLPDGLAFTSHRTWFAQLKGGSGSRAGWDDRIDYVDSKDAAHEVVLSAKKSYSNPGMLGAIVAENNRVWVSAAGRHSIVRYDVGSQKTSVYRLGNAYASMLLPFQDAMWYADPVNHRIVRMDPQAGNKQAFKAPGLIEPYQLEGSGEVMWIRDYRDESVWIFDVQRGAFTKTGMHGAAMAASGETLWIAIKNDVLANIDKRGVKIAEVTFRTRDFIAALALDPKDGLWAALVNPATGVSRFARIQHPRECGRLR